MSEPFDIAVIGGGVNGGMRRCADDVAAASACG